MSTNQPDPSAKPYDQLPGEPHKWFSRFPHFCQLGPNRTLIKAYRDIMTSPSNGQGPARTVRTVSQTWRQRARQYDWQSRAADWDRDQRQRTLQHLESTIHLVGHAAREAIQFQIDLMRGWIKDPDGSMIPVLDIYQRRMASKALLRWAVELQPLLQSIEQAESGGEVKIREIVIHRTRDVEQEKNNLTAVNRN